MTVASIRYNNPGAMWGGNAIATKYGATKNITLNDGLGQGNTIAFFPDVVHGGSAQFALWNHGYTGMTLAAAIRKWSGGNSSIPYMTFLTQHTGLKATDVITPGILAGPKGLALMKAQAQWEAGQPYPMTDTQWQEAQRAVFGPQATQVAPTPQKPTTALPSPIQSPSVLRGTSSIWSGVKSLFGRK